MIRLIKVALIIAAVVWVLTQLRPSIISKEYSRGKK